mgnify:CR=1 FL=1
MFSQLGDKDVHAARIEKGVIAPDLEENGLFGDWCLQLVGDVGYKIIPHTILIDQSGRVMAITDAKNITEAVIAQVLDGKTIDLPLKADNLEFSYTEDYFKMDTTTLESFVIQPGVPGAGTFSMMPNQGPFDGRRISMINFPIDGLYRKAYQTTVRRMDYEVDEAMFAHEPKNLYALGIIVAPEQREDIYEIMKAKIAEAFPVKARSENRTKTVVVLTTLEEGKVNLATAENETNAQAGSDHFKKQGTLAHFTDYLESYGIIGMPVLDETNLNGQY